MFAGLTRERAAEFLGVSLRTIGHWETGKARPAFAAFKLLRVLRHGELVDPAWDGYRLVRGKLVTPENREFSPADLAWLSLLVRRSHAFSELLREREARAAAAARGARAPGEQTASVAATVSGQGAGRAGGAGYGLVYSSTSETLFAGSLGFAAFRPLACGPMMGPEWGHVSQTAAHQTEPPHAAGPEDAGRSAGASDGGESQHLLPAGASELHSVYGAAGGRDGSSASTGILARDRCAIEGGRGFNKSHSADKSDAVAEDGAQRPVPLRFRSQGEALSSRRLLTGGGAP